MAERVWEHYLTERDKAHLAMTDHNRIGFGDNPALLLIDLYRWVFGDYTQHLLDSIEEWPSSCGLDAWEAVPHIQALLQAAREAKVPIVHMTSLEQEGLKGWGSVRPSTDSLDERFDAQDRRKRKADIIDEVAPMPGDPVLLKSSPSAF